MDLSKIRALKCGNDSGFGKIVRNDINEDEIREKKSGPKKSPSKSGKMKSGPKKSGQNQKKYPSKENQG